VSTPALICDTGALLDYLVSGSTDHDAFREAIDQARARYVPALVLPEVDYFLRYERKAMRMFMHDLARGAFTYAPAPIDLLDRAMEIDREHTALGLGLVDASVMALAEQLGVYRVATRDIRHFTAVRLRGGRRIDLVVRPARPER